MGFQLDLFDAKPNARVIMRQGDKIVIAVDGSTRRVILNARKLPEDTAARVVPGAFISVTEPRRGQRQVRVLDERPQPAGS